MSERARDRSSSGTNQPSAITLIDGYNLMFAAGPVEQGRGPLSLQRSRLALLNALAESIPAKDLARTVVVFDAHRPPPGLPRTRLFRGLRVHFASNHEDADALIEELISAHSAPKQLTVVSSDHRLQRAARRRKAKTIDSDVWYEQLLRERGRRGKSVPTSEKPPVSMSEEEVDHWLREFGSMTSDAASASRHSRPSAGVSDLEELAEPFPPGYFDDLLDEDV